MCKYCENGKINKFGEEWYGELPFVSKDGLIHNHPQIFKTNGKYFLVVENFYAIEIKACPMCGANFETPVLSTDADNFISAGDTVAISDGPDVETYKDSVFEVLTEPYEVGGETVVKIKDHKSGKYFGGGYTTKYLKKVKEHKRDSSATPQNDTRTVQSDGEPLGNLEGAAENV